MNIGNENPLCYGCNDKIDATNSSYEHIILNACGGMLKSNKLLCAKCNKDFGNSFDNVLAAQCNEIANLLMINRFRGEPQPVRGKTKDGVEYKVLANGDLMRSDPKVEVTRTGDQVKIHINAADENQFKQVLKGLKKKHPALDIEEASRVANRTNYYLDEAIHFQMNIGGEEVFRSVAKSAINYFIHVGGKASAIKHLIPYLEGKLQKQVVWFHYPEKSVYLPKKDEVSNLLRVIGNPEEKVLYAYIELFNIHKYFILLNHDYSGPKLDYTYGYDLINNHEIHPVTDLSYSRLHAINLLANKDAKPHHRINESINRAFKIADDLQTKFHLGKLIRESVSETLSKYPPGTKFTHALISDLTKETTTKLAPFIANQLRKRKPED